MKIKSTSKLTALALLALLTLNSQLSTAFALGTVFTYQGELQNNGSPISGTYNLTFSLFNVSSGGTAVAGPVTTSGVIVTNGLFTVQIDFGAGVFTGATSWLQIGVETNGVNTFTTLSPRQQLTPTPYAIYSPNAGNAITATTAGSATSATSAATATTANSFSGSLAGDVTGTQSATAVSKVGGVSAANVASGANAANAATSANTANAIVQRDGSGSFLAQNVTLGGNLNLPYPATIYSGGNTILVEEGSFFAGLNAGLNSAAHDEDVGVGDLALSSGDTGGYNVAVGESALQNNTTGYGNTANGWSALLHNTTGDGNTASGYEALLNNTIGFGNIAIGSSALYSNTTGNQNTAVGGAALADNTSGSCNVANGENAMQNNTSGSNNTANGYFALYSNTTGSDNVADGYKALYSNTNGTNNTANGFQALYSNTTGSDNTANGYWALYSNTTGSDNTANGYWALYSNTSGYGNVANGLSALYRNTTGNQNTAVGQAALAANITGSDNTANGVWALYENTTGSENVAEGDEALYANTSGSYNVALGLQALVDNTGGSYNIGLGYQAGAFVLGSHNIDIGNEGLSTDNNIIRIGSGQTNAYIAGDVFLSGNAGTPTDEALNISGSTRLNNYNIYFRTGSDTNHGLGFFGNGSPNGDFANVNVNGPVLWGNGGGGLGTVNGSQALAVVWTTTSVTVNGTFNNNSDRNAKEHFTSITPADILDKVVRLPVSEWSYKVDGDTRHIGPMAQDFYSEFNIGTDDRHIAPIDEGGVALAAIKGLNQKVEEKEARIQNQSAEIMELKARLDRLEQAISGK